MIRTVFCWLAYVFIVKIRWPLDWWPTLALLPYAGEYAYRDDTTAAREGGE